MDVPAMLTGGAAVIGAIAALLDAWNRRNRRPRDEDQDALENDGNG